jgi:hypothetical protein
MSKAGWTSPNEPWDKHPRPMARTALQAARKAGWWLNKSNAGAEGLGNDHLLSYPAGGPPQGPGKVR